MIASDQTHTFDNLDEILANQESTDQLKAVEDQNVSFEFEGHRIQNGTSTTEAAKFVNMCRENVEKILQSKFTNKVLVLVSTQLGMKTISSEYYPAIHKCMNLKQFIGAVGGRPNLAYFFVGTMHDSGTSLEQNDNINKVVYLDPHKVKGKIDNIELTY